MTQFLLRPLQPGKSYEHIKSDSYNPFAEHSVDVLNKNKEGLNENLVEKYWGKGRCWKGYEPVPGRKLYSKGSCRKRGGGSGNSTLNPRHHWNTLYDRLLKRIKRVKKPVKRTEMEILRLKLLEVFNQAENNKDENEKMLKLLYTAVSNRHLHSLYDLLVTINETMDIPDEDRLTFNQNEIYSNYDELNDLDDATIGYNDNDNEEEGSGRMRGGADTSHIEDDEIITDGLSGAQYTLEEADDYFQYYFKELKKEIKAPQPVVYTITFLIKVLLDFFGVPNEEKQKVYKYVVKKTTEGHLNDYIVRQINLELNRFSNIMERVPVIRQRTDKNGNVLQTEEHPLTASGRGREMCLTCY